MKLPQILILISVSLVYILIFKNKGIDWFILIISIIACFWLQPISTIRSLDYWLPMLSIFFGILTWSVVTKPENIIKKENLITYLSIIGM
ncbi:MAG: hypothetical protein J7L94_07360, partial [Caldisericaceae bacterium]|nr:hypothetical protein [Caldisericaceae bacterium]